MGGGGSGLREVGGLCLRLGAGAGAGAGGCAESGLNAGSEGGAGCVSVSVRSGGGAYAARVARSYWNRANTSLPYGAGIREETRRARGRTFVLLATGDRGT